MLAYDETETRIHQYIVLELEEAYRRVLIRDESSQMAENVIARRYS